MSDQVAREDVVRKAEQFIPELLWQSAAALSTPLRTSQYCLNFGADGLNLKSSMS